MAAPKKSVAKKADAVDEHIPTREEALGIYAPALAPRHERSREILHRLRHEPPQVILLEGGTLAERVAFGHWYAALHSCLAAEPPCLECATCVQVGAGFYPDVTVLDGRESSIRIDDVRELRASLGEAPRGDGKRVVLFLEAQFLGIEAANALLKSLEEPRDKLCFVLIAPQRERLLPTLVSRGWTITLPWPDVNAGIPPHLVEWVRALDAFLKDGSELLGMTSVKGAADAHLVRELLLCLQKTLASVMGKGGRENVLAEHLALLPEAGCAYLTDVLAQAQESLAAQVNPALVLDWVAVRLFQAVQGSRRFRR